MVSAGAYSFLVQLIRRNVLVKIRVVPGVTLSAVPQTAQDRKQIIHEGRSFTTGRNERENAHVFCRRGKHILVNMKMNKKNFLTLNIAAIGSNVQLLSAFFLQMKNERKLWLHLLHFMVQHNDVAAAGPSIPLTKTRGLRQTWRKRKRKTLVHGSPIFIPLSPPSPSTLSLCFP